MKAHGWAAFFLAIIVFAGIFLWWPAFFLIWLPFILYSHHHSCPACRLRID